MNKTRLSQRLFMTIPIIMLRNIIQTEIQEGIIGTL